LESLYKYRSPKAAKTDCRRRGAIAYMKTDKQIRKCEQEEAEGRGKDECPDL